METEDFLQLNLHIKSVSLAECELTFISKYASHRKYNVFSSLTSHLLTIIKNVFTEQNNGHFQYLLTADQFKICLGVVLCHL